MTTPSGERLALTVEEAAALLGLSRSAAYAAVKAGRLPSVRIGGAVRVPRRALEAWLEEHTTMGRAG